MGLGALAITVILTGLCFSPIVRSQYAEALIQKYVESHQLLDVSKPIADTAKRDRIKQKIIAATLQESRDEMKAALQELTGSIEVIRALQEQKGIILNKEALEKFSNDPDNNSALNAFNHAWEKCKNLAETAISTKFITVNERPRANAAPAAQHNSRKRRFNDLVPIQPKTLTPSTSVMELLQQYFQMDTSDLRATRIKAEITNKTPLEFTGQMVNALKELESAKNELDRTFKDCLKLANQAFTASQSTASGPSLADLVLSSTASKPQAPHSTAQ